MLDSHKLMEFCLKMAGMMYLSSGTLLKIYSYYLYTSFYIFGSSLLLYIILDPKPPMEKLQTFHYLIALIQIYFKFTSIFKSQEEIADILRTVKSLSNEAGAISAYNLIVERANRLSIRIAKIFLFIFCAYYPIRVSNLLLKYYVLRRPPQLFLEGSWIPQLFEAHYVLGIFYQVFTSLCIGFTNASYSCLICYLTLQVASQIEVLKRKLEESNDIEQSIRLHQKLLRLFLKVNRLLSGQMFVEIVMTSIYSCICSFLIIKSLLMGGKDLPNLLHILILVLMRSFLICYCGNIILEQGEKLHTSAYFGTWYTKGLKYRKALQQMLTLTTVQPFKYNYRHILTMDMSQFMKSMQTTYSYLTMLLSLVDH